MEFFGLKLAFLEKLTPASFLCLVVIPALCCWDVFYCDSTLVQPIVINTWGFTNATAAGR